MKVDMTLGWKEHLKNGNVWRTYVELPMQDEQDVSYYSVSVDIVSPNQDLAQYIATTMYPDYLSVSVEDDPIRTSC